MIVGLVSDALDEACTHVGESVTELDGFGNGDTVFGDFDTAEGLVNEDVSAVGSKGDLDGIGKGITSFKHFISGIVAEEELLGSEVELKSSEEERSELVEMSVHEGSCYRVKRMDIILIMIW